MFTARHGLIPYIQQITFRLSKVKQDQAVQWLQHCRLDHSRLCMNDDTGQTARPRVSSQKPPNRLWLKCAVYIAPLVSIWNSQPLISQIRNLNARYAGTCSVGRRWNALLKWYNKADHSTNITVITGISCTCANIWYGKPVKLLIRKNFRTLSLIDFRNCTD